MAHIPGHISKDITPEEQKYGVGNAYSPPQPATPGILGIGNMLPPLFNNRVPLPDLTMIRPGFPEDKQLPIHRPLPGPLPDNGLYPIKQVPDFQDQFNSFNETLGGFKDQVTGFGDQVTGFGDKMTGIEKGIMDRLAKIEEGIAGLMPQGAGAQGAGAQGAGAQATVPYGNSTNQGGISSVYTGTNSRGY